MEQATLQKLTNTIVEAVHPEQLILFGSHARGDWNDDSDVDLLIVESDPFGEGRSRQQEIVNVYNQLRWARFPIDILIYSREEFEYWRTEINHVVSAAVAEGRVLYAA